MHMFYVYVLQHESGDLYIGYTSDLKKRFTQHNNRENKSTNRTKGNWSLIYYESYKSQLDAEKREHKLKHHGSSKHELHKRLKNSLLPKTGAG